MIQIGHWNIWAIFLKENVDAITFILNWIPMPSLFQFHCTWRWYAVNSFRLNSIPLYSFFRDLHSVHTNILYRNDTITSIELNVRSHLSIILLPRSKHSILFWWMSQRKAWPETLKMPKNPVSKTERVSLAGGDCSEAEDCLTLARCYLF